MSAIFTLARRYLTFHDNYKLFENFRVSKQNFCVFGRDFIEAIDKYWSSKGLIIRSKKQKQLKKKVVSGENQTRIPLSLPTGLVQCKSKLKGRFFQKRFHLHANQLAVVRLTEGRTENDKVASKINFPLSSNPLSAKTTQTFMKINSFLLLFSVIN